MYAKSTLRNFNVAHIVVESVSFSSFDKAPPKETDSYLGQTSDVGEAIFK